ncbi:fatty acid synthase-like [Pectinophora gossypiella]|uniref:fatty acid synthase-like n=1 Tax=Pectinophora gossypiella TaxID=13191 RepID=UPI00214E34F0|nr:fatty acid synthase-like [Pectinophora gossypiella]
MAPKPQYNKMTYENQLPPKLDGESVVISGMSGLYPQSHSVKELSDVLYNKVNPVTASKPRWKYTHPEVPPYNGVIPDLDRFDAQFFKVHYRQAVSMDSMSRKILEQAYQAIYDAGLGAEQLSGKKIGVYIGSCFSESEKASFYDPTSRTGFGISGCSKTMFANRISYWLNAKGPSMAIDEACCSSLAALEQAYQDMSLGDCEAAIVGGASLCLHPQSSVHYGRIIPLCKDGKTKSFDESCDGCARSEAVNVLFLQKAKNALRIYAHVLHVKNSFTSVLQSEKGPRFGLVRDPKDMAHFIKQFYDEANVPPNAIEYVEAFGSASAEADKAELEAIEEVFCQDRTDPLLVGSVISNIGYTEAASGISAITKTVLGYQKGELAANLHCLTPRRDVASLRDGRMRIVTEHQPFHCSYTAINSISITGVNAHVLLHGHYKPKDITRYQSSIPRLVTVSGRQESAVKIILDDLKSKSVDPEEIALLHNIHELSQPGHMSRGFTILDTNENNETVCLMEKLVYFDDVKRPLWFVYSGMGSQWAGMGAQLMRIPVFAAAIERCHKVLSPKGLDIVHIITTNDKTIFDNILHSFVGIAAVQIGLTDVLKEIGIVPDNIIGHSVGELGCAYADGCLTAEEMILSAYSRGLVSLETPFIRGSMAAVGIGYEQVVKLCPPEIDVACHNGPDSSTISGPADAMRDFVAQLTSQGIFAKEVPCSNIAYHSRYIAEAGPKLLQYLSEVIKDPKPRSELWLSSSVPQDRWGEANPKLCSAWYHTNNLLSPVLFEETSRMIPANAVLVEVAPHGLLQAILKRSLSSDCRHIPLTRRGHPDNALLVLEAIGKLHMEGFNPKVKEIYPKVEFPVSTGTPMLSHLIEWSHIEKWTLPLYVTAARKSAAVCNFIISIHDDEHAYLQGNKIGGKLQYPFAATLVAVWDTLAMASGMKKKELSVQFRDVHLFSQPALHDQRHLQLTVTFHRGTGCFEVMNGLSRVATGFISTEINQENAVEDSLPESNSFDINSDEVYEMLKERDYFYTHDFRSIHKTNTSFTKAQIVWKNNWVTFIDGLLQLNAFRQPHCSVSQPSHIHKIVIDVEAHSSINFDQAAKKTILTADLSPIHSYTRCGGVVMNRIEFYDLPPLASKPVDLKSYKFVPHFSSDCQNLVEIFSIYLQMAAENSNQNTIKVVEISNQNEKVIKDIVALLKDVPESNILYNQVDVDSIQQRQKVLNADVVLVTNLSLDNNVSKLLQRVLRPGTFIINGERIGEKRHLPSDLYQILCANSVGKALLEFAVWKPTPKESFTVYFVVNSDIDLPKLSAKRETLSNSDKLLVLTTYPPVEGLKDLVKKWRHEVNNNQVYLAQVSGNEKLEQFPIKSLNLNFAFNILNNGIWGGEYYVSWQENVALERGMTLQSDTIGDLDSLHWVEVPEPTGTGIKVTVRYAGINNFDVKRATGLIPKQDNLDGYCYGMDFSGTTDSGDRVMGLVPNGAASGRVIASPELLWPVPAHWTLEDAATVPLAYAQAFYCLGIKAQLCPGMTVLVHGGAGALGQAAISIALAQQCQVFATVSTTRKKHFLNKLFPELKAHHIGNSRDESFGDMVLRATKGRGCDIIISGVQGGLKNTTLNCASFCGITFDTVQAHTEDDYTFGMFYMTKQRSYILIDFANIFDCEEDIQALQKMMSEGIARGYVRPLSRVTYAPQDAARAFRLLAASKHRGRVLLRLRESIIAAQPRIYCPENHSDVVFCDSEGFGLQLAGRLVKRGTKKLRLHCSLPLPKNLYFKVNNWRKEGIVVEVSTENLATSSVINTLSDAIRMGPVGGIYLCISNSSVNRMSNIVSTLDSASRKKCPSLKYFAILNTRDSTGQTVCLNRARDNLPGTLLRLPSWPELQMSRRGILDAIEKGLHSAQRVLLVQTLNHSQPSLLQQLAVVADIEIPNDNEELTELKNLGLDNSKAQTVCAFLHHNHNISVKDNELLHFTAQKLKMLEDRLVEPDFKNVSGLETFFSYVDSDELLASTPIVFLPTLVKNSKVRDDELDSSQTYLSIVPGLEGHHERFRTLCERLKLSAVVLQPGVEYLNETLQETAQRYTQTLLKKIQVKNNFYLVGYESGVKVALEIAANLEKEGLTGTVYCLGGTPEELEATINEKLGDFDTDEAFQNALVRHMSELMAEGVSAELDVALKGASNWQEKLNACVNTLLGRVSHSKQYTRLIIESAFARVEQMRRGKVQARKLQSRIVVLRAASNSLISSTEEIQRYSQKPIVVYNLPNSLAHFAKDPRCAAIINRHFDEEVLQTFENRNLCDTYLLNADVFITKTSYEEEDSNETQ